MHNMIINIRGGSGSGKTTVARAFLDFPYEQMWGKKVINDKQEIKGYLINCSEVGIHLPLMLIGSYETACGGTDSINTQEEIGDRIEASYRAGYHVMAEGLLMSKSGPKGHISPRMRDLGNGSTWFAFLDTPVELCVERVLQRRVNACNMNPFDPKKTLYPGHKQAWKSKVLLDKEGNYNTFWLDHTTRGEQEIIKLLKWGESNARK